MPEETDHELLARFVQQQSDEAFSCLVQRHVGLVYSVALRHIANPHHAEDITQVVFMLLAKKAMNISPKVVLAGWLYRAAQLTAANYERMENRRLRREQEVYQQSLHSEPAANLWTQISPLLDLGMGQLRERERDAIVLRFFESKSLAEVGAALRISEEAAQKRVERAIVKLRGFFTKRGIVFSAAALTEILPVHSARAAPSGLGESIAAAALLKGAAVSAPAAVLMKSSLKAMTWLKFKAAAKFAMGLILIAGTTTAAVQAVDYVRSGRVHLFQGDYDRAAADFNQAIQLDPQSVPAHFGLARASKLSGNYEQALRDYTATIQLNPGAVAAYINRGQIYNLKGDHDRAIADFDRAIQLDGHRPIAYLDRGVAYVAKGDYHRGVADFRAAIQIDPEFSPAYNNLALQLATCPDASIRDGEKAVEYATKACELSQWNNLNQISTLAAACAEAGDFNNAIKWENKILAAPDLSPEKAARARERLVLYQAHRSYHRQPLIQSNRLSKK